jgi:hypothetical protein
MYSKNNHKRICKKTVHVFNEEDYHEHYVKQAQIDDRYEKAANDLSDALDLVFFNANFPQNQQTVRKTNKKSDLIEIRISPQEWDFVESAVAIPRIQMRLESVLNTRVVLPTASVFKDILYHKTKRGPKSEEQILEKYNGLPIDYDTDNYKEFLSEIEGLFSVLYNNLNEAKPTEVREYIMNQAKAHDICHFGLRHAEDLLQSELKRLSTRAPAAS